MSRPSSKALVVVAVLLLAAASLLLLLPRAPGTYTGPVPSTFSVNGKTYAFTAVATTEGQRESGLMNAKVTGATFVLFAFPRPTQESFYMYQVNSTLDMIWVNATGSSGTVVFVVGSAPPCSNAGAVGCPTYAPPSPANFVIEAKGGFAAANGVEPGSLVTFA